MGISLVGTPTTGSATNGGNLTLSLPTGLAEDDVVYILHQASTGSVGSSYSGWTEIGTGHARTRVWRKVMGASPDSSLALTVSGVAAGSTESNSAVCFAFRGVSTTVPEDATSTNASSTSTNPDPASATPETDGAWCLVLAGSNVLDAAITAPSGYSNHTTTTSNDSNDTTTAGATKSGLTALVAEDPPSWTNWDSGDWRTTTIILRPNVTDYTIDADAGSYVVTGADATLAGPRFLSTDAGSYTITGATADLLRSYTFEASSGSYEVTGSAATFTFVPVLRSIATLTITTSQTVTIQTATPILTVQRNQNISINTRTPELTVQ